MAKPAWYYERQATIAKAREEYFRNNQPVPKTTVEQLDSQTVYYRSVLQKVGAEHATYSTSVSGANLALVTPSEAGLLETVTSGDPVFNMRRSGLQPSKASWYKGANTPVPGTTSWGSRTVKYYDSTGGRSHYSIPLSKASGAINFEDIRSTFQTIFGGVKRDTLLGAKNGRASLALEYISQSIQT